MSGGFWLSVRAWEAIEPLLPKNQPGARRVDDRRVISGRRAASATEAVIPSTASGVRGPSGFQLDGFWKAHGMRSSIREAGCRFAMAVKVSRR